MQVAILQLFSQWAISTGEKGPKNFWGFLFNFHLKLWKVLTRAQLPAKNFSKTSQSKKKYLSFIESNTARKAGVRRCLIADLLRFQENYDVSALQCISWMQLHWVLQSAKCSPGQSGQRKHWVVECSVIQCIALQCSELSTSLSEDKWGWAVRRLLEGKDEEESLRILSWILIINIRCDDWWGSVGGLDGAGLEWWWGSWVSGFYPGS